jgi:3-dehydroquinate synthetase
VTRSVEIKAGVVSRDEHESGERAILNAGHTVAHALERLSNYSLPHGEAVAIGLVEECRISERMKLAEPGLADSVARVLAELGLPTQSAVRVPQSELATAMRTDKKNRGGRIRMALPAEIGRMARDGDRWTFETPDPPAER